MSAHIYRKGIGLIFSNLDTEIGPSRPSVAMQTNLETSAGVPGSSLFFVRVGLPGIGLPGDRDVVPVRHWVGRAGARSGRGRRASRRRQRDLEWIRT